jgi:hypothetical protein
MLLPHNGRGRSIHGTSGKFAIEDHALHQLGAAADHIVAMAAGRVLWTRCRSAAFAHPHTPYTDRATGLLVPVVRNLTRFFEIAIRLPAEPAGSSLPGNTPFLFERRVPDRKRVPAIDEPGAAGLATCVVDRGRGARPRSGKGEVQAA